MIITIDGPAGTGKSTVTHKLAQKLGFNELDTGALYRAIAAGCLQLHINPHMEEELLHFLQTHPLKIENTSPSPRYIIGEIDVTGDVRSHEVTSIVSDVAASPSVRSALLPIQRALGKGNNLVCEGRDMGTTVFPHAEIKFFLTATAKERAKRRFLELQAKGTLPEGTTESMIQSQIEKRDSFDSQRKISPLSKAADSIEIDTSFLDIDEVVETLIKYVVKKCTLTKTDQTFSMTNIL